MIVGIDLGTTNSLIAVWREGRAELIPNALGQVLTPSCVSIDANGEVLVGLAARERLQTHPERSATQFKRYMGSDKQITLASRRFRPEELSALVLRSLKADAEAALQVPVTRAIITVPAYFSDAQRKATRAAGELAGLRVERLLNEPTAAALAHGLHLLGQESRFLDFDLGGGTFDVSVLDLFEGVMEVRASAGDNALGGEDFVNRLSELCLEALQVPQALRQSAQFLQVLAARAESAKRELSHQQKAQVQLHIDGVERAFSITEPELEHACASLLKRLRSPVERALRDTGLNTSQLDAIVLAGGATRMPMVRRLVTTMFGRFPNIEHNPDEVVALGAAVQGGLLERDAALNEVVMTDVTPYSMGVEVSVQLDGRSRSDGQFDPVIERNTVVPTSRVKTYCPVSDQQNRIELRIYQGEARLVRDNILLGTINVPLPGGPASESAVDVRFSYDVNGLLQIETLVQQTGRTQSLLIESNPGLLSSEDIAQRLRALDALKIHPRDQLENRTLLARGERMYASFLGAQREWLGRQTLNFEQALASQDPRKVREARRLYAEALNQLEGSGPFSGAPEVN